MQSLTTLIDLFQRLEQDGSSEAIVALGKEVDLRWTRSDLLNKSRAVAGHLRSNGLQKRDRVAIIGQNHPSWVAACLGAIRAGGTVVPIDAQFEADTLESVLEDAQPKWIVASEDKAERLDSLKQQASQRLLFSDISKNSFGEDEDRGSDAELPEAEPDDPATLFYTSGTTGAPKGVPLTHRNLVHQLNVVAPMQLIKAGERLLLPLPLHHVYAFSIGMLLPLHVGVTITLPASMTGPQIVRALREERVNVLLGVPRLYRALRDGIEGRIASSKLPQRTLLRTLLACSTIARRRFGLQWGKWLLQPLRQRLGPSLRVVATGGSAIDDKLAYFLESLGWQLASGYGLTETAPLLSLDPPGRARIGSVGKPIEGIEIRIASSDQPEAASEEGSENSKSEEGEVLARGPSVFQGYLHLENETKEAFTDDGWFKTGDLGHFDKDGYLYLSGRASTLIVTESGENLQPEQVEDAYAEHRFIRETGVMQQDGRLVALIVPDSKELRNASQDNAEEAVRKAIEEVSSSLPSYQRLNDFVVSGEAIARTRLGKIKRDLLRDRYAKLVEDQESGTAKEKAGPIPIEEMSSEDQELFDNPQVETVWEWLAERYPDRRLTPDTSPQVNLEIDSMEWLNLSMELRQRVGIELAEEKINEIETLRDLLRLVGEGQQEEGEQADLFDDPEKRIGDEQRRWMRPLGPFMRSLSAAAYTLNRLAFRLYFRPRVSGLDRLPDKPPFVIVPNHQSFLDAPTVAAAMDNRHLRKLHWMGSAGIVLKTPWMRLVTRIARIVPTDTQHPGVSSLACGASLLKRERSLVVFPEGRVSPSGKLGRFQPGVGLLAEHFERPIVPVWIEGTREALGPGKFWPRPQRLTVRFGSPLDPKQLREEGSGEKTHERITSALRDHMEKLRESA